jgi:GNAT superfamily N-acetyltransferase
LQIALCPPERSREAADFVRRVLHDEFGFQPDPVLDADLDDPVGAYAGQRQAFWIVLDASATIRGTCAVRQLTSDAGELKRMFVEPANRGRGLGRALLERALDFARNAGFRRLLLDTTNDLVAAGELYRSAGFRDVSPYNDNPRAERWMELEL